MAKTKQPVQAKSEDPIAQALAAPTKRYAFADEREHDREMLKGVFRDLEVKGGVVKFVYKKWPGDDIKWYELHDGQEYELPRGVVKHLNNLHYVEDSYCADVITPDGRPTKNANPKKVTRFSFLSSEYV
jgi:hypothetical protein